MKFKSVDESKRALAHDLLTRGVWIAYNAALEVCGDTKAAAPARSSASATIIRAAGLFNRPLDDGAAKQPHEMSAEDLNAALRNAKVILGNAERSSEERESFDMEAANDAFTHDGVELDEMTEDVDEPTGDDESEGGIFG